MNDRQEMNREQNEQLPVMNFSVGVIFWLRIQPGPVAR